MKKSLKKLNLSRETLRILEGSTLNRVGGNAQTTTLTRDTNCIYTNTCPELCDPFISDGKTCLCD